MARIAANLRRLMSENGRKVKEFAEATGTSEREMYRYRSGRKHAQSATIKGWARELRVEYGAIDPEKEAYYPGAPLDKPTSAIEHEALRRARDINHKLTVSQEPDVVEDCQAVNVLMRRMSEEQRKLIVHLAALVLTGELVPGGIPRRPRSTGGRRNRT